MLSDCWRSAAKLIFSWHLAFHLAESKVQPSNYYLTVDVQMGDVVESACLEFHLIWIKDFRRDTCTGFLGFSRADLCRNECEAMRPTGVTRGTRATQQTMDAIPVR